MPSHHPLSAALQKPLDGFASHLHPLLTLSYARSKSMLDFKMLENTILPVNNYSPPQGSIPIQSPASFHPVGKSKGPQRSGYSWGLCVQIFLNSYDIVMTLGTFPMRFMGKSRELLSHPPKTTILMFKVGDPNVEGRKSRTGRGDMRNFWAAGDILL